MNNEDFFQQFRQMFSDPFQRRELVEYFDKLVHECTANPKPMRVAVVGIYSQFQSYIGQLTNILPIEISAVETYSVGGVDLIYVGDDEEAQGIQVDCYCLASDDFPTRVMELCAYMVARNIPAIKRRDLYKEIESRLNEVHA